MAENLETPSFGNFSIENTMEMGMGSSELLNDLMSPETASGDPDGLEKIVKEVDDPAPAAKPKAEPAKTVGDKIAEPASDKKDDKIGRAHV